MNNQIAFVPVSAIIPCYKSTQTLERAVLSVWKQVLRPRELILIDDGSPDKGATVALMYQLQKKYGEDWISIIELGADLGVSTARNSGWEKATQKYIAFLDSDDSWHWEKVAIQYQLMEEHPHYMMSGHHFKILSKQCPIPIVNKSFTVNDYSFKAQLFKNQFVTPSVMIRRDCPIRFQVGRSDMDDHLLWLEIASKYGPGLKINLPLAFIYKSQWGEGGLNSRLWTMEKGEIKNFTYLYQAKKINAFLYVFLIIQSLVRFLRRIFIQYFWRRLIKIFQRAR